MRVVLKDSRTLGVLGLLAVMIYLLALFIALLTIQGFSISTDSMSVLGTSGAYVLGCVVSGILVSVLGLSAIVLNKDRIFIGRVRNFLTVLIGLVLILWALVGFNDDVLIPFEIVTILILFSDTGYGWVSDARVRMLVSALFLVLVVGSSILDLFNGIISVLLFAVWAMLSSLRSMVVHGREEESQEILIENEIIPENEQLKTSEDPPLSVEIVVKSSKNISSGNKTESEVSDVKHDLEVEDKKGTKKKSETLSKPKDLPSLNVMSSRDAAVARDVKKSKSPKEEDVCGLSDGVSTSQRTCSETSSVSISEVTGDTTSTPNSENHDEEEVYIQPDTPDVLVRRAAWNKGLRCRRDYGEYKIPVAFVKGKVAVFVLSGSSGIPDHDALVSEGWTILSYLDSEITDGKLQGEEIYQAVKDNLKKNTKRKKR